MLHTSLQCPLFFFFFQLIGGEWLALYCLTPLPHSSAALSAALIEHHFGFHDNRRQKTWLPTFQSQYFFLNCSSYELFASILESGLLHSRPLLGFKMCSGNPWVISKCFGGGGGEGKVYIAK